MQLIKGKYINENFEDVLQKDLPYCEYILSMKYVSKEFAEFKDWLQHHIYLRREQALSETIKKANEKWHVYDKKP